jgi:hypothetical protein
MRTAIRILTAVLVLSLIMTGPLAPAALAQQPAQPAQPTQPPAPPVQLQPAQPDLFQETLKAERAAERGQAAYDAGAVVVNTFLVPGRTITCVLGGAVGIVVLALTFGSGYKAAADVANEGCGGKWVVTGDDLRPDAQSTRPFDWERN